MNVTEALTRLRELRRQDRDVGALISDLVVAGGYGSLPAFAEDKPDDVIKLCEEIESLVAQTLVSADSHVKTAEPARD